MEPDTVLFFFSPTEFNVIPL